MAWMHNHNWSPRELQAVGIYAEKPMSKLRKIQECIKQQIEIAYAKHNDVALWRLQRLDLIVTAAIDKKCFS